MIVVIGATYLRGDGPDAVPDGLAGRLAVAAASSGAAVELIAKVGDDRVGDALLIALARFGVGHVAVLRDPTHPTARRPGSADLDAEVDVEPPEPAGSAAPWVVEPGQAPELDIEDVGLALRYLTEFRVVVAIHPSPGIAGEAASAAAWGSAHLVIVMRPGDPPPTGIPVGAVVLEATEDAAGDSAIGSRLGAYAAAVDAGTAPSDAYAALTAEPPA